MSRIELRSIELMNFESRYYRARERGFKGIALSWVCKSSPHPIPKGPQHITFSFTKHRKGAGKKMEERKRR
jgi:hypothetical protein